MKLEPEIKKLYGELFFEKITAKTLEDMRRELTEYTQCVTAPGSESSPELLAEKLNDLIIVMVMSAAKLKGVEFFKIQEVDKALTVLVDAWKSLETVFLIERREEKSGIIEVKGTAPDSQPPGPADRSEGREIRTLPAKEFKAMSAALDKWIEESRSKHKETIHTRPGS